MPYRRRKKRYGRRRRRNFRRTGKQKGNRISPRFLKFYDRHRMPAAMPFSFQTKLVYKETFGFTSASEFQIMRFIPSNFLSPNDLSTIGYKLFPELNAIYNTIVPLAFDVRIQVFNKDVSGLSSCMYLWPNAEDPTNFNEAAQQRGAKEMMLAPVGGGPNMGRLHVYGSQKELFGMNPLTEEEFWSADGATPSRTSRLFLAFNNLSGLSAINCEIAMQLVCYVRFMNRELPASV